MHTTTKKLKTIGLDDGKMCEAYFLDMAERGLILEDAGLLCYTFRKELPQRARYCIHNFPKGCSKEIAQHMRGCGWTYICDDDEYYVFRGEDDARDAEIPAEDQILRWETRKEDSNKRVSNILMAGVFILIPNFFSATREGFFGSRFVLYVTLVLFGLYQMIDELISLKKAKQRVECLNNGEELTEDENWKRKNTFTWIENLFMVTLWLLLILGGGLYG